MGRNPLKDLAVSAARANPVVGLPRMAAALRTRKGEVIVGLNSRKTHPLAKRFGKNSEAICLHAEVDAIRRATTAGLDVVGASVFIARVGANDHPRLAKPCLGCQRALIAFDVKDIQWTY